MEARLSMAVTTSIEPTKTFYDAHASKVNRILVNAGFKSLMGPSRAYFLLITMKGMLMKI